MLGDLHSWWWLESGKVCKEGAGVTHAGEFVRIFVNTHLVLGSGHDLLVAPDDVHSCVGAKLHDAIGQGMLLHQGLLGLQNASWRPLDTLGAYKLHSFIAWAVHDQSCSSSFLQCNTLS